MYGMAGVGKTGLLLQAAHTALASGWFPGGVLFTDVLGDHPAGGLEASEVLAGFLGALGVPARQMPAGPQPTAQLHALVMSAFARRGRRILVLVDNATSGRQVEPLLAAAPSCPVIVTSRELLEIPCSLTLTLSSLAADDAAELLHRALNVAHSGDPRVRDDPGAAATICDLCGGLPLALRIAGALLAENPALPLATMAANLQDGSGRLDELSCPGGSVRACFDGAYQHLDPEPARMFRLLSVHPGPDFSGEDAAVLAGVDLGAARPRLTVLTSLLECGTAAGRWRMPVLVRLYANEHGLRHAEEDGRAQALRRLLASRR